MPTTPGWLKELVTFAKADSCWHKISTFTTYFIFLLPPSAGHLAPRPQVPHYLVRQPCLPWALRTWGDSKYHLCLGHTEKGGWTRSFWSCFRRSDESRIRNLAKSQSCKMLRGQCDYRYWRKAERKKKLQKNMEVRLWHSPVSHLKKTSYSIETGLYPLLRASPTHPRTTWDTTVYLNELKIDRNFESLVQKWLACCKTTVWLVSYMKQHSMLPQEIEIPPFLRKVHACGRRYAGKYVLPITHLRIGMRPLFIQEIISKETGQFMGLIWFSSFSCFVHTLWPVASVAQKPLQPFGCWFILT